LLVCGPPHGKVSRPVQGQILESQRSFAVTGERELMGLEDEARGSRCQR
jgi:hypothetical protein